MKLKWLNRVRKTQQFHIEKLKSDINWTINDTATVLNRSYGSVAEDLMIAQWLKTHERQLLNCRTMQSALEYVREKKREMRLEI